MRFKLLRSACLPVNQSVRAATGSTAPQRTGIVLRTLVFAVLLYASYYLVLVGVVYRAQVCQARAYESTNVSRSWVNQAFAPVFPAGDWWPYCYEVRYPDWEPPTFVDSGAGHQSPVLLLPHFGLPFGHTPGQTEIVLVVVIGLTLGVGFATWSGISWCVTRRSEGTGVRQCGGRLRLASRYGAPGVLWAGAGVAGGFTTACIGDVAAVVVAPLATHAPWYQAWTASPSGGLPYLRPEIGSLALPDTLFFLGWATLAPIALIVTPVRERLRSVGLASGCRCAQCGYRVPPRSGPAPCPECGHRSQTRTPPSRSTRRLCQMLILTPLVALVLFLASPHIVRVASELLV